jgi:hypothetical protein
MSDRHEALDMDTLGGDTDGDQGAMDAVDHPRRPADEERPATQAVRQVALQPGTVDVPRLTSPGRVGIGEQADHREPQEQAQPLQLGGARASGHATDSATGSRPDLPTRSTEPKPSRDGRAIAEPRIRAPTFPVEVDGDDIAVIT